MFFFEYSLRGGVIPVEGADRVKEVGRRAPHSQQVGQKIPSSLNVRKKVANVSLCTDSVSIVWGRYYGSTMCVNSYQ
jgi:hypothetical protein